MPVLMRSSWSAQSGSCHVYYSVLWADLDCDPAELTVVMEPTRNAWAPVAAWFKRRGAKVVLVPSTQSSDLRAYYSKHTKNDRLGLRGPGPVAVAAPRGAARARRGRAG